MIPHSAQKMRRITTKIGELDKEFVPLIARRPLCTIGRIERSETNFESLVSSIISQQLATKAAETIYARLRIACKSRITARKLESLSEREFRAIGISGAKTRTIKGLSAAVLDKSILIEKIDENYKDEEIFDALTSLWGIGRWTVEMFMMFQLGRLNIWPIGDLAVRRGWDIIHKNTVETLPRTLDVQGEKLQPYRSVAAWYCYQAVHESRGLEL